MPRSPITVAEVASAYSSGETINELADRLGTSRATIWRRLQESGVAVRRRGGKRAPLSVKVPTDPGVLGYIAGIFDGEGNLYWRQQSAHGNGARMSIYSTTPEVITWLETTIGGRVRWDYARVERHGWKPMGDWSISRAADVTALLTALIPYLIIKRDKARQTVELLSR